MLVVEVLGGNVGDIGERLVHVHAVAAAVVPLEPEVEEDAGQEEERVGSQVEPVADAYRQLCKALDLRIVRPVVLGESPGGDETANVTRDHDETDTGRTCAVGERVGGRLRGAQRSKGEGACGNDERRAVADVRVFASQEHDVADDGQGSEDHHDDEALVELPREEVGDNDDGGADYEGRNGVQLLADDRVVGVDCGHDGREEEGHGLRCDVVKEEDPRANDRVRVEDTEDKLALIDLVEHSLRTDILRLDARNSERLLLGVEPARRLRAVGQRKEGNNTQADRDDSLDEEEVPPAVQAPDVVNLEDTARKQAREGSTEGRRADVQRDAERKFRLAVPSRKVVRDAGEQSSLKDAKQEAHAARRRVVGDERGTEGDDLGSETVWRTMPCGAGTTYTKAERHQR